MLDSFSHPVYLGQARFMTFPPHIAVVSVHSCPLARPGTHNAGGMNIYIRETARAMASLGIEVDIFTHQHLDEDECPADWPSGCRVIHLPAGPAGATTGDLPAQLDMFAAGIIEYSRQESRSYGGIISHYWLSGLVAHLLRRLWDTPHIAVFHTLTLAKPRAFQQEEDRSERAARERDVVADADALLAATNHERDLLVTEYGAMPHRIVTASPGVDTERFHPLDRDHSCHELGLPNAGFRLLFAGRTIPMKGIPVLIESLAQLPADVSALIVGGSIGDAEQGSLAETAQRFKVADRVRFEGTVPHEQLPTYFGASDLCIVPSYYESYGMVALEALACGCPVVASQVGGLESIINNGVNGLLIPPGSAEALSEAVLKLLADRPYREAMGRAGIETARRCNWESTTDAILRALATHSKVDSPATDLPVAVAAS